MSNGAYLLAVVFSGVTSALAAVAVPELTQGHGWAVQGVLSLFGVFFYADALRYVLDDYD